MHYAIHLQKIDLGEGRVVFRPVNLIKGNYLEYDEIFIDERGFEYCFMKDNSADCERYFCCPATMEELKKPYGDQLTESEILDEFLSNFLDCCFLGYYDELEQTTKVIEFDFYNIEKYINNMYQNEDYEDLEEDHIQFDPENNEKFIFSLQALKELKEYQTVEEIRNYIDKLIEAGNYIKKVVENKIKSDSNLAEEQESKGTKKSNYVLKREESTGFDLAKLRQNVLSNIVGQDEAVYNLTRTIAVNQTSNNYRNKSHILISGPSGTGKTEMVRVVAKELDIPFFAANCPDYTKAGYYGKEVPDLLLGLIRSANGDQEKAQHGILILDEIDKLVTYQDDKGFGKAVLHELLKILDRDVIEVDVSKSSSNKIMFDTSNLTVICMGSFDELYEQKKQNKKNTIGFGAVNEEKEQKVRLDEDDFIGWMGPEFVGRVGEFTETDELTHKTVLKILKESKISQWKIAQQDFAQRGINLYATVGYLNAVADKGYSKKLGVRKLNKEVKRTLRYVYDEVLTNPKVKSIKLTKKTVTDNKEYCVEY